MILALALVASTVQAAACDDPAFSAIPEPAVPAGGKGVAMGESTLDGSAVIGSRFAMASQKPLAGWQKILAEVHLQDEWVPDQFGYDFAEWIDPAHVYLRFDVGLVYGAIHVRRQLVALIRQESGPGSYTTCWKMVDPAPYARAVAPYLSDVDWERASAGWWSVRQAGNHVEVGYQWWTEVGHMPAAVIKYGMSTTIPDLLDAFDAYAGQVKLP